MIHPLNVGNATVTSFDPLSLNPLLWLDANDASTVTEISGKVSQWDDKSGNGFDAAQPTGAERPTYTNNLNGRPTIEWPNSTNSLSLVYDVVPITDDWQDTFIVVEWTGGVNFNTFNSLFSGANLNTGTGDGIGALGHGGTKNIYTVDTWVDGVEINDSSISSPFPVLPDIATASVFRFFANSSIGVDGYRIGFDRAFTANSGWRGYISEILSFDTKQSAGNATTIVDYLKAKWGIS